VERAGLDVKAVVSDDNEFLRNLVLPLASEIRRHVAGLALPRHDLRLRSLRRCASRLSLGLPISAQGQTRESLRTRLLRYRRRRYASREEQLAAFRELLLAFREDPVDVPTILLSCHMMRRHAIETFGRSCARGPAKAIAELKRRLESLDKLVLSSIRVSGVHRSLQPEGSTRA
jgi:hypothetical protein